MGGVVPDISDRWRLVLGTTFVLFVIFLPRGIVSIPEKLQSVTRRARDRGGPANQDVTGGDD
jgi:branched-chain amino acid transport system permease protein